MTKPEYDAYVERVERYLVGIEFLSTGPCYESCEECQEHADPDGEPWFSWQPCEICGAIGGMREHWHGLAAAGVAHHDKSELIHGTCCEDCVYFLNYGRLDDTTMWEVEHGEKL